MFFISPTTAGTFALADNDQPCIMFVLCQPAAGTFGRIKIEALGASSQIGDRLAQIDRDSAYPAFLIGILYVDDPIATQRELFATFIASHIHHDWFETAPELVTLITSSAQDAIGQQLMRPDVIPDGAVDIDEMAKILGISAKTLRRRCKASEIPCLRIGGQLRFVPNDVLRSMQQR